MKIINNLRNIKPEQFMQVELDGVLRKIFNWKSAGFDEVPPPTNYGKQGNLTTYSSGTAMPYITRTQ